MPTPVEATVRSVLAKNDRGAAIRSAIADAWDHVTKTYVDRAWWRRQSTQAGLVWEYSVNNLISAVASDPGIQPVSHLDTMSFVLDDTVLVRLKKADLQLKTRNYPTRLATLFHQHDADLFGYAGLQRVEVAYVLNRFKTSIDWIGVVARERSRMLWHIELDAAGAVIEPFELPASTTEPAASRVMKPKAGKGGNAAESETE